MDACLALAALETRRLFRRPLAWLILSVATALMASFYLVLTVRYLEQEAQLRAAGVTAEIVVRYFGAAALIVLVLTPLITMQSVSGDGQRGMLRFLFSTPVSAFAIIGGKLLAVLALLGLLWFMIGLMPVTLVWGASIDGGVYLTNLAGLALFMLLHACLGVMCSALLRQPIAAGLVALSVSLMLWLADWAQRLDRESTVLGGLSTLSRLRGFAIGLLDPADAAYFLAGALGCTLIAVWAVEDQRRYA